MIQWLRGLFAASSLDTFDGPIPRERLIQAARIVMIDDEVALLVEELRSAGFSVDHDREGNDLRAIDQQIYDLAILDYHGVGARLGAIGRELLSVVPTAPAPVAQAEFALTPLEEEITLSSPAGGGALPEGSGRAPPPVKETDAWGESVRLFGKTEASPDAQSAEHRGKAD